jgi:hypothetical protein
VVILSKKNCESCNKKEENNWKFCPNCGEKLEFDLEEDGEDIFAGDLPYRRGWTYFREIDRTSKKQSNRVVKIGRAAIPYNKKVGRKQSLKKMKKRLDEVGANFEFDNQKNREINELIVRERELEEAAQKSLEELPKPVK